jgi:hypothetical protein
LFQSSLTITGTHYGTVTSTVQVIIESVPLGSSYSCDSTNWNSSTSITCTLPADLPVGPYTAKVTVGGQNSTAFSGMTHYLSPVISAINPGNRPALGNTSLILTVSNLFSGASVYSNFTFFVNSTFTVNRYAPCSILTLATVNCTSPQVPFSAVYNVSITIGGILQGPPLEFTYNPALISFISPSVGSTDGGYILYLHGVNFGTGDELIVPPLITLDGNSCLNAARLNDSLMTCSVPAVIIS